MLRRFMHKRLYVALTAVAVLAIAGAAFAYFSSSGSGTGSGSVGSAAVLTVAVTSDNSHSLFPGSGSQTLTYSVTNPSAGHQNLSATTAVVASSGGTITQGGVAASGCLAAWFTAVNHAPTPLPQNLAGGATSSTGTVDVTMQDSGTNQDSCQGKTPDITVSAS